nr:integrase, catalytic region, zinc finger, CCHC-type, peptidase aspartic, catalytic [Tanacetum cinerariifolium]
NNREAHVDYLRNLKESVETIREIVEEAKVVVQIVLWYLDSSCSKHMMGDHSRLMNFMKKFIGTVRFKNDYFSAIIGYGDYVIGDSVISRVYYVEGLGHNLFSVKQICDSDLEVAFKKYSWYVRDTDGIELINGSRCANLYTISVEDMMKSSPICLLSKATKNKSWLWHWRLNHLNFGTINDLARKDLVQDLGKQQPTADIGIFVGYAPSRKVQVLTNSAGTPSSATIDQDGPSASFSSSSSPLQSPNLRKGIVVESTLMEDNPVAPLDNTPFINVFALEPSSDASSFGDVSST